MVNCTAQRVCDILLVLHCEELSQSQLFRHFGPHDHDLWGQNIQQSVVIHSAIYWLKINRR